MSNPNYAWKPLREGIFGHDRMGPEHGQPATSRAVRALNPTLVFNSTKCVGAHLFIRPHLPACSKGNHWGTVQYRLLLKFPRCNCNKKKKKKCSNTYCLIKYFSKKFFKHAHFCQVRFCRVCALRVWFEMCYRTYRISGRVTEVPHNSQKLG